MASGRLLQVLALTLCVAVVVADTNKAPSPDQLKKSISHIYDKLKKEQSQKDVDFRFFPLQWHQQRGIFSSDVHLNFHGDPQFALVRNQLKFPDDNMFVTNFISMFLLEAHSLGAIKLEKDVLNMAVDGILAHRVHAAKERVPLFNFWNEKNINGTWVASPTNLNEAIKQASPEGAPIAAVKWLLKVLGQEKLWDQIEPFLEMAPGFLKAFLIPPDSDDTGVNLALAAVLRKMRSEFPEAAGKWDDMNDVQALLAYYKKYAYRPFSEDPNASLVDPRTYYWMRKFLLQEQAQAKQSGRKPSLSLVSTWMMNTDECRAIDGKAGTKIPFNVNNVDPTVAANAIFGMSYTLLNLDAASASKLFDADVQALYYDSARLLAWVLENSKETLFSRPDLVLVYYPPIYDFYWFVARHVKLLASAPALPLPVMEKVRDLLAGALEKFGTPSLLETATESKSLFGEEYMHWDDFLGQGDTLFGRASPKNEDRVFSTAVAANALFDTWTLVDASGKLTWKSNTPAEVKTALTKAVTFLHSERDAGEEKLQNAFFSGSVKGLEQIALFYPGNVMEFLNGTKVSCDSSFDQQSGSHIFVGVRGVIPEEQYQKQLSSACFGVPVPQEFKGFNQGSPFPYWSSPAMSRAASLLALAKAVAVSGSSADFLGQAAPATGGAVFEWE